MHQCIITKKMKCLVVACLVTLAVGKELRHSSQPLHYTPKIVDMIVQNGYSAETYTVITWDYYILKLFRMSCLETCLHGRNGSQENQERSNQNSNRPTRGPAVLLMHTMLGSAEDWIYGGPSQGLAYQLADQGMDVYLGNSRGSVYGRGHVVLNPSKDAHFWDFTWDNIANEDVHAIVNRVMDISHQPRIQIVGHMTGATATIVMVAEDPYGTATQKVAKIVALGPVSFMKKASQPFMKVIQANRENKPWIMKNLGQSVFIPSIQLMGHIGIQCKNMHPSEQEFCLNLYFLVNGFNSNHLNQTTMKKALRGLPSAVSVRQLLHMAELMETGRFTRYYPGPAVDQDYNLTRVTVPTFVMYAPEDRLSQIDDVQTLVQQLPNARSTRISSVTNNIDLLFSNNVSRINQEIIDTLSKVPYREETGQQDNFLSN